MAKQDFKVAATKLTADGYDRLRAIAAGFGLNVNELLGAVVACIIKYFDHDHDANADLLRLVGGFTSGGFGGSLPSFTGFLDKNRIAAAILFVKQDGTQKRQVVRIKPKRGGGLVACNNVEDMLRDLLLYVDPDLLGDVDGLRVAAQTLNTFDTIRRAVDEMIQAYAQTQGDRDAAFIDSLFSDNENVGFQPAAVGSRDTIPQYKAKNSINTAFDENGTPYKGINK